MPWFAWVMLALYALNAVATVLMIGKRREPITPGLALPSLTSNGLMAWGIVSLATA